MLTVTPDQIQPALMRLWESQKQQNKIRASLFNLVLFCEPAQKAYIHTLAERIIAKFPSRILLITQLPGDDLLTTQVSVMSDPASQGEFACDLIAIEAAGASLEKLPFLLLAHLLPDLPILSVWAAPPNIQSPLLDQLKTVSQRMIFDSSQSQDLNSFASSLLTLSKKCEVADLTWARIENWRRLLSATFHSAERLVQLKNTEKLHILYNSSQDPLFSENQRAQTAPGYLHPEFQALYLHRWLSTQLGWKPAEVEVILTPEKQPHLTSGCILSVDLSTRDQCHFSFGRDLHIPHQISMRFSTLEKCDIPLKYIFSKGEAGAALVKEIGHPGTSPHFLNLIESFCALPPSNPR